MPTPLELRLHDLAAAFARQVAGIVSGLTIEELAALCGEDGVPVAKAPTKKARPAPKAGSDRRKARVCDRRERGVARSHVSCPGIPSVIVG